jgi:hypothetical protein
MVGNRTEIDRSLHNIDRFVGSPHKAKDTAMI